MLNNLLFLLLGLVLAVIHLEWDYLYIGAIAVGVVLVARYASVLIPFSLFSLKRRYMKGTVPILTWGGLRGGLAFALAMSIPSYTHSETGFIVTDAILVMTYMVVLFSILIQGSTIAGLIRRYTNK